MIIEYIPVFTTLFSVYFFLIIYKHYRESKKPYLLWWTLGVFTFGLGTATESVNAIFGWSEFNFKLWYISGALLGGFPLAQGSVYLLMNRRFADFSMVFVLLIILIASFFVVGSPLTLTENFNGKLDGKIFSWQWVRYFSPLINVYSFIFLVGGAVYSAVVYYKQADKQKRFLGNILIAIGALLPGIGGSFTRAGYVNVLFVTEFVGLILIYLGYVVIKNDKSVSIHQQQVIAKN
jgi:hypothetical protein